jgi:hypothetical protein
MVTGMNYDHWLKSVPMHFDTKPAIPAELPKGKALKQHANTIKLNLSWKTGLYHNHASHISHHVSCIAL